MKDPRDAVIEASISKRTDAIPKELIDDLKFFDKRRKEGRQISGKGLLEYVRKKYGAFGRQRLWNVAKSAGIEPWWSY